MPVVALAQGERIQLLPAGTQALIDFDSASAVQIYRPASRQFAAVAATAPTRDISAWRQHAELWSYWRAATNNPATLEDQRRELLSLSREHATLLPSAALIVVETAAQWEILERKEQQSLKNHNALDFEEAQEIPEPASWLMLGLGVLLVFGRRLLKKGVVRRGVIVRQGSE